MRGGDFNAGNNIEVSYFDFYDERKKYCIQKLKILYFQLHEYMTPEEVMSVFHTPHHLGKS